VESEISKIAAVSQAEVDSAYNATKDDYKLPEDRLRASQIIIGSVEEAEAIYNRLKKGDEFAKMAVDYSLDRQGGANGGDLGYFTAEQAGNYDPAFSKAVSGLKVGEYSHPVKTRFGYHLILLTDRMAAGTMLDSTEVKTEILAELEKTKKGTVLNGLVDSLRVAAKIEKFTPPGLELEGVPDTERTGGK
jgi:parvulin-like peptidyl-prolyl isomerase